VGKDKNPKKSSYFRRKKVVRKGKRTAYRTVKVTGKKRERTHVIASQSTTHVKSFIDAVGFTAEEVRNDYGYDLLMSTFDEDGEVEAGMVYLQLKATDRIKVVGNAVSFSMDIRDYNLWTKEPLPVFLIVYDAKKKRAYWLYVQSYFGDGSRKPKPSADSITVRIPLTKIVDEDFIRYARERKIDVLRQLDGRIDHNG
jgi:Domain of unknown function (DUF4365)